MKIIDAYHATRPANPPKKLHIVYFTPSDRDPELIVEKATDRNGSNWALWLDPTLYR